MSGATKSGGSSLPRADTGGESRVIVPQGGTNRSLHTKRTGAAATPRHLLTENGHHLAQGAAWRLDTAGGPKPYVARPSRPIVAGTVARCKCGETTGYGPDPAVASDLALRKCFKCRVRSVAALDPRGPNDAEAFKDAVARIHQMDIESRKKGGCDCDLPVGRLFNRETAKPFGWTQGHEGQSRSQAGDWEGGENRSEARALKFKKLPWWERGPTPQTTPGLMDRTIRDQVGRLGGQRYFPCRSFVYAPTKVADRPQESWSNALPDARLKLEFVYGYNAGAIVGAPSTEFGIKMGSDAQDNLRWLDERRIVYFTAATAIVYDIPLHRQRFFFGHDDAITCLAISPSRKFVATGQMGQYPKIFVWNPMSSPDPSDSPFKEAAVRILYHDIPALFCMEELPPKRLMDRRVTAITFAGDERLVAVGGDDGNAFMVWDLSTGDSVFRGSAGVSPVYLVRAIYGWADSGGCQGNACTRWSRLANQKIMAVTTGAKHIGFWTVTEATAEFPQGEWVMTKVQLDDNPLCMIFAMSANGQTTELFTGHQNGSIQNWVGSSHIYTIKGAHRHGVTQLAWTAEGLLSGGVDCKLKIWRRKGDKLEDVPFKSLSLKGLAVSAMAGIADFVIPKSIDVLPSGEILLGTTSSHILKVAPAAEWVPDASGLVDARGPVTLVLAAHYRRYDADSLQGVATYPVQGVVPAQENGVHDTRGRRLTNYFATCGPDHTWRIWNTSRRRQVVESGIVFQRPSDGLATLATPSCIDISPNGLLVVLGFTNGGWCVYLDTGGDGDEDGRGSETSRQLGADSRDDVREKSHARWRQIYITDTSQRDAHAAQVEALEKRLQSAQGDPFAAQHTDLRHALKQQIQDKRAEMAKRDDFSSSMPTTVVRFAPNGWWVVVGARDGKMQIFSLRNLEVSAEGTPASWRSVTELHLALDRADPEAFTRIVSHGADRSKGSFDALQLFEKHGMGDTCDSICRALGVCRTSLVEVAAVQATVVDTLTWLKPAERRRVLGIISDAQKTQRTTARKVIAGEVPLQGVRGDVKKLGLCVGHGTAITHCDWSLDCRMLRSTSETCELLFWDAPKGTPNARPDEFRDVVWATHTVPFGWPVQGIWPVQSDGSYVHAVDVSRGAGEVQVCATGDVLGHVKLFRYPCVGAKAAFKSYIGHASHVRNLTFTEDNRYIITVGGHDCSIFQWRYIPKFPDKLPSPHNDADLKQVAIKASRFERQVQRRLYAHESAVTIRLVLDGNPSEVFGAQGYFSQKLRVEICDLLGVSHERVLVNLNLNPLIIADVTFELSSGGKDFVTSRHYASELMKLVAGAYAQGPSQTYLMLNQVTSATLVAQSEVSGTGGAGSAEVLARFDKREAHSSDIGFTVRLSTMWHEVDDPGVFGRQVLIEIARAAEESEAFQRRVAGLAREGGPAEKSRYFFAVKSVHKDRDALVVDMKFINDPDGKGETEDLSQVVIQELSGQILPKKGVPSTLNNGEFTHAVKSIAINTAEVLRARIPLRLEIERALGYNGSDRCGAMQLLTAYYFEELDEGGEKTKVQKVRVQLIYTAGNMVVMEDCSKGRPPAQRFFHEHAEDITCLAVHPNGYLVATADAGAEPTLIMWHSDTLATLQEFSQHTLEINPTDDDYLGQTRLAGSLEALPTYGALTKERYVAASFTVHDARDGGIVEGVYLKIDKEIMCVDKTDGNRLVCRRALQGTVAGRHVNGAVVLVYEPTYRHEQSGGIACVAFTKCDWGRRLVSVSANKTHTIMVYDTVSGRVTQRAEGGGQTILAIGCHPNEDVVVTCGIEHLIFWKVTGTKLKADVPHFGNLGRAQTFLCVDFCYTEYQGYNGEVWPERCPGGIVTLTGSADGCIYMWEHNRLQKVVSLAHYGPVHDLFVPDASTAIAMTAGQDGVVRMWNLSDQTAAPQAMLADDRLLTQFFVEDLVKKNKHGKFAPASRPSWSLRNVRSFEDRIFVGTGAHEIFQLEFERAALKHDEYGAHVDPVLVPRTAGCGFEPGGSIVSLACHPSKFECVTAASGGSLRRWNVDCRPEAQSGEEGGERFSGCLLAAVCIKQSRKADGDCVCVDYSPDGAHVAVGLTDGSVLFADSTRLNLDAAEVAGDGVCPVSAIKFAPDPRQTGDLLMAVARGKVRIDLVQFRTRKVLSSVECDAPAGVPSLDWTLNADVLMTSAVRDMRTCRLGDDLTIAVAPAESGSRTAEFLASWSSVTGDAVSGLHSEDGINAGVTCAHRMPTSKSVADHVRGKVVAFGDDFGKVNMATFPCEMAQETVGCDRSRAHDGPVASVAFTHDGSLLVSAGAKDLCLLIWRVISVPKESSDFSDDLRSILSKYRKEDVPRPEVKDDDADVLALVPQYSEFLVCRPEQAKMQARDGYGSLPREQLKLTHCYMYRAFDSRGNVGVLRQCGHVVYLSAGLAVVHNAETNTQRFFTKHRANICCLALHPTQDLVATGSDEKV